MNSLLITFQAKSIVVEIMLETQSLQLHRYDPDRASISWEEHQDISTMTVGEAEKLAKAFNQPKCSAMRVHVKVAEGFTDSKTRLGVLEHLLQFYINPHNERLGYPEVVIEIDRDIEE